MKHPGDIRSWALIAVGMLLLTQCSPYAGKSVLHFLFDGVPVSDSTATPVPDPGGIMADTGAVPEGVLAMADPDIFIHYPYGEKDCASCHNEQALGSMLEPEPGLCYTCHEDLGTQYAYLHGPVAGGYCTACHDPHRSENDKLLKRTGDMLCFYCHEAKSILGNEMHSDLEGMPCMDCHNPHGGEDKYIFQ